MKKINLLGFLSLATFIVHAAAVDLGDDYKLDVPYVPTGHEVVQAMLDVVELRDGDIVWDLGCGDGRIVIAAALRKEIRGFGVDIDPARIEESTRNARLAGVHDRVTFLRQDLFRTDFRSATVLAMYLLHEMNLRLRPTLLSELAPGTRVVSHAFSMGEWEADEWRTVEGDGYDNTIYYWIIPANLTGVWDWKMGQRTGTAEFAQSFQALGGSLQAGKQRWIFSEGEIQGKTVRFTARSPENTMEIVAEADGDRLTGKAGDVVWTATRKPGTETPLDSRPPEIEFPDTPSPSPGKAAEDGVR